MTHGVETPQPTQRTGVCGWCGGSFSPPRRRFCSDICRYRHRDRARGPEYDAARKRTLTCARCGGPVWQGPKSRPQGVAECRPCRSANKLPASRRGIDPSNTNQRGA